MASRYEIEVEVTVNRRRGPTRPSNKCYGEPLKRTSQLTRPSGRPHRAPDPYRETSYGVPPPAYAKPYGAPQPNLYYAAAPPAGGYSYGSCNAPPPQRRYGQPSYGQAPQYEYGVEQAPEYGGQYGQEEKKKSKFGGMGTGLAVGAVAAALGGMAVVEDEISDDGGYDEDDF